MRSQKDGKTESEIIAARLGITIDEKQDTNRYLIKDLEKKNNQLKEILEYCKGHESYMWAARILGIILECDFRDVKSADATNDDDDKT